LFWAHIVGFVQSARAVFGAYRVVRWPSPVAVTNEGGVALCAVLRTCRQ
jgi:hypothetical protein